MVKNPKMWELLQNIKVLKIRRKLQRALSLVEKKKSIIMKISYFYGREAHGKMTKKWMLRAVAHCKEGCIGLSWARR